MNEAFKNWKSPTIVVMVIAVVLLIVFCTDLAEFDKKIRTSALIIGAIIALMAFSKNVQAVRLSEQAIAQSIRPVLEVTRIENARWTLKNYGNGPALKVYVIFGSANQILDVCCHYPLGKDEKIPLIYIYDENPSIPETRIVATYQDVNGTDFSVERNHLGETIHSNKTRYAELPKKPTLRHKNTADDGSVRTYEYVHMASEKVIKGSEAEPCGNRLKDEGPKLYVPW